MGVLRGIWFFVDIMLTDSHRVIAALRQQVKDMQQHLNEKEVCDGRVYSCQEMNEWMNGWRNNGWMNEGMDGWMVDD